MLDRGNCKATLLQQLSPSSFATRQKQCPYPHPCLGAPSPQHQWWALQRPKPSPEGTDGSLCKWSHEWGTTDPHRQQNADWPQQEGKTCKPTCLKTSRGVSLWFLSECCASWEQHSSWFKLNFFSEYCYSDSIDTSPATIFLRSATITPIFHFCPQKRGTQPACALRIAINPGKYLEALQLRSIFFKTSVYKDWSIVKFNSSH